MAIDIERLPARFAPGSAATTPATRSSAASAAKAIAAAPAKSTPAAARFAGTSLINGKSASTQLRAVERFHGFIRVRVYRHLDKSETARLAGFPVLYNLHPIHLSICGKRRIEILLSRLERDVPDINILQGLLLSCCRKRAG
jgi:hypothetical protein